MTENRTLTWTSELVHSFWDGVANSPLDDLSFGRVAGPQFLDLIQPYLRPQGRHLDFGAGSGHMLKLLLERGYPAAGFDPAPGRQSKLAELLQQHPMFLGVDGMESNAQYDVVLLMEVIEHILEPEFEATLERIARFVAPGGLLIVSTPNNEDLAHAQVFCPISQTYFHPWQHVRSFTPQLLGEALARHGLRKEAVMLADFSNDAAMIAELRVLKMRDGMIAARAPLLRQSLAASTGNLLHQTAELTALASDLRHEASLWQCLLRCLQPGSKRLENAERLKRLTGTLQQQLNADAREIAKAAEGAGNAVPASTSHGGIDLRIGKETTIVYVARKPSHNDHAS